VADRLFIIDGTALVFRSFFAIRGLTNSKGQPTNAAFGFARALLKLVREQAPSHVIMVFDAPGKTFRDEIYSDYKATRPPVPGDLISQLPLIDRIVEGFQIPVLRIDNVEADDVIGTLAKHAEAAGMDAVIVTSDKDAFQLVSDRVRIFDHAKGDTGVFYGREEVREKFGVYPEHVIDALALMGDTVDNVPGVRGIGEKTAKQLLEQYGSLEGIYAHVDELKGKQKERLIEDRDSAYLSRTLATIKTDVVLDFEFDRCRVRELENALLGPIFESLEFNTLAREFSAEPTVEENLDYRLVLTEKEFDTLLTGLKRAKSFAIDTETTSTDPMAAKLVGISLSWRDQTGFYIPVGHAPEAMTAEAPPGELFAGQQVTGLSAAHVIESLRPFLGNPDIGKIGHNIKYDLIVFARAGAELNGIDLDTMVASYLTDSSRMRHNLDEVSLQYLKRKLIPISELIGKGAKSITFDKVPITQACEYACEDADISWRLSGHFRPILRERGLEGLYEQVEKPLIYILAKMEMAGIAIDPAVFRDLGKEVRERLAEIEKEIYELAGGPFQINSPKQLQEILFGRLALKPARKTKTGYSTDVDVLEELAREHPLPERILEFRTLDKLRGTYIEALPKLVHPETGRIHTSFNQAVAATGRLSSSDPNLQNIPIRTDIGRRIRRGFVAGGVAQCLISADYSQIELRILAHLCGDQRLRDAFFRDTDVHRETAARVFGVPADAVTPEMRRQAKAVNFGVIYGMSAFGLARSLGISNSEASRFIDNYFSQYPGVKGWIESTLAEARERGYVTTLLQRRRYVPELRSPDMQSRKAAERVAVNTPVQGSAADIIKVAMVKLDTALRTRRARLVLQVHDELVVEAHEDEAEVVAALVKECMESAANLEVPLKVDVGIGKNWAEIH
jgi:DNA polymerase-1